MLNAGPGWLEDVFLLAVVSITFPAPLAAALEQKEIPLTEVCQVCLLEQLVPGTIPDPLFTAPKRSGPALFPGLGRGRLSEAEKTGAAALSPAASPGG